MASSFPKTALALLFGLLTAFTAASKDIVTSPNKNVKAEVVQEGGLWHLHAYSRRQLVADVALGFTTEDKNFADGLRLVSASAPTKIKEDYTAPHGKRSHIHNEATVRTFAFATTDGEQMQVEVRAYNDGLTFRYILPAAASAKRTFTGELTAYTIPADARRWMQRFATSYEDDFPLQEGAATQGAWGYPALFQAGEVFALITEAGTHRDYCHTHLDNSAKADTYRLQFPFPWEGNNKGEVNPTAPLPWASPWRVIVMGDLATVFQSTLVEDVSPASTVADASWIEPAGAAWVYWAYNHGTKDYQVCCQYVDLAVSMGWKYVLFDWEWDVMENGGKLEDAVKYACERGIKPLMWYNSGGPHNGVPFGPRDRLLTHENRCREFEWLKSIGVAGIKIDFFESDKQDMIRYYLDILEDAAAYKMLINFHGCTIPRGWSRTYPHLMSMEAVYGAEQYNNSPRMTSIASRLNATLPFTRNVVGPMDYTPVAFTNSQHPHVTTYAHELALSVVFESGIQHWADRPSGFLNLPDAARRHMSRVPNAWDDSRLLSGYPGTHCTVARRSGEDWYVGAINGEDKEKTQTLSFDFLKRGQKYTATIIADGATPDTFSITTIEVTSKTKLDLHLLPQGGCVIDLQANA